MAHGIAVDGAGSAYVTGYTSPGDFAGDAFVVKLAMGSDNICLRVTEIPASECNALVALYNSTNGPGWTDSTGWLTTNTPCSSWHGVGCSAGHVTYLGLLQNNLSGTIPGELGHLTELDGLTFFGNQLTGAIPAELGQLTKLTSLELVYNQLAGSIPRELGNLNKLEYFALGYNQLTGSIPAELGNLTKLEVFDVSGNWLSGPIPAALGGLSSVKGFVLRRNQLSGSIPPELGNLAALDSLYLDSNQLAGTVPASLCNPASLTNLDLGYNKLTGGAACITSKDPDWAQTQTVAPTNLAAQAQSSSSVQVSWTPILYTADGGYYEVGYATERCRAVHGARRHQQQERRQLCGDGPCGRDDVLLPRAHLHPGAWYQKNALWSEYSQVVQVTTPTTDPAPPSTITDLVAIPGCSSGTVVLRPG